MGCVVRRRRRRRVRDHLHHTSLCFLQFFPLLLLSHRLCSASVRERWSRRKLNSCLWLINVRCPHSCGAVFVLDMDNAFDNEEFTRYWVLPIGGWNSVFIPLGATALSFHLSGNGC